MYSNIALLLLLVTATNAAQSKYFIGDMGDSCFQVCMKQSMNCNPNIVTNNSLQIFADLGVKCVADPDPWWAPDQPAYVTLQTDPNYGKCVGYMNMPTGVHCGGSFKGSNRLCKCDAPTKSKTLFGNGYSNGVVGELEEYVFQHFVAPGDYGVMTHFWFTIGNPGSNDLVIRYYIDGEKTASIAFDPALASGVGFNDTSAPWGTKWIGKGARDGSFFINFRVPFQKSIAVTAQHPSGNLGGFYIIVRGATNLPLSFGNVEIPPTARLRLFPVIATYKPLEFVTIASVPSGPGVVFMHTLSVQSANLNFLEGCYHWFTPDNTDFPGVVLATGTEDYFDSGWYFNAGGFHLPTAGLTHMDNTGGQIHFSAYRFHEQDPLTFTNGFTFQWRNGDVDDKAGLKCFTLTGSSAGDPQPSMVRSYVWAYTW